MPETTDPVDQPAAPAEPPAMPIPPGGGSYVFDPATGQLVREGGTAPQTELTPNEAFDQLQKKG